MVVRALIPVRRLSVGLLALALLWPLAGAAQTATPPQTPVAVQAPAPAAGAAKLNALAGVWDGAAQTPNGEMPIRMTLAVRDGKLTGGIEMAMGTLPVTSAALNGDLLELGFDLQGEAGTISARVSGDRVEGSWSAGGNSGGFAVARTPTPGAGAAGPAQAADPISGEWEGAVDISGQSMAFTLTLTVAGGAVTGDIASAAGKVPLTASTWKDGTLTLTFPYMGGEPVSMGGQIVDGKLTGSVNYNNGELLGAWTAVKKK